MRYLFGALLLGMISWGVGCEGDAGIVEITEPVYAEAELVHCMNCKAELPYMVVCSDHRLCRECDECFKTCITCRGEVQGARICPRDGRCHRCDQCDR